MSWETGSDKGPPPQGETAGARGRQTQSNRVGQLASAEEVEKEEEEEDLYQYRRDIAMEKERVSLFLPSASLFLLSWGEEDQRR